MKSKRSFWLEAIMYSIVCVIGFITITSVFSIADYKVDFSWTDKTDTEKS
ncbi:hypothetical protein JI665_20090 [Bacillus sp. NTK034]|nr:hypothetical protein [Bacillus sp. NTK034]MBN8202788.1 hypothetical protein [Bacillus sp. NTK034]